MVISYKCPVRGDDMAFDAESGTLACRGLRETGQD